MPDGTAQVCRTQVILLLVIPVDICVHCFGSINRTRKPKSVKLLDVSYSAKSYSGQTVLRIVKHQTTACSNCAHNTPHNDWLAGVLLTYSWGPILLFGAGSLQFLRQLSLLVSMMSMLRWGGGISRSHMVDATLMVRSSCGWYCWHHPDMGRWVLFGGVGEFSITPGSSIFIYIYRSILEEMSIK